jgi:hypothetical protein
VTLKHIKGVRLRASEELASHTYICDLLNVDFPLLSLYSDGRNSWLYLWADTDNESRERWLLFKVGRTDLSGYLQSEVPLKMLVEGASRLLLLEIRAGEAEEREHARERPKPKRYLKSVELGTVVGYVPHEDSLFDPSLTTDLDLAKQIVPSNYEVPIHGDWFESDFEYLFKRYRRLYAFFYATRPRFVKPVQQKLKERLRAPWRGGSSRVNMYGQLARELPAIHALRVSKIEYASPGFVRFEALPEIGDSIQTSTMRFLDYEPIVTQQTSAIKKILDRESLNKEDLSGIPDAALPLDDSARAALLEHCSAIAICLQTEDEFETLRKNSPNLVVYSKAVNSVVRQLHMLALLQRQGMLNFDQLEDPFDIAD